MAIINKFTKILTNTINEGDKVLFLGYPHILGEEYKEFPLKSIIDYKEFYHNDTYDGGSYFESLGWDCDYLDIYNLNDKEIIHDLNEPLGEEHWNKYDFVVDNGTFEHVFCPGTAYRSSFDSLKVGGKLISFCPISWLNHGFYSISPELFISICTEMKWPVEVVGGWYLDKEWKDINRESLEQLCGSTPKVLHQRVVMGFIVEKATDERLRFPVQNKYKMLDTVTNSEYNTYDDSSENSLG